MLQNFTYYAQMLLHSYVAKPVAIFHKFIVLFLILISAVFIICNFVFPLHVSALLISFDKVMTTDSLKSYSPVQNMCLYRFVNYTDICAYYA